MRIQTLKVKGYKRLALSMIDSLEVEFTELLQLILGTNGSGKSSLLRLLNPLPIVPAAFRDGGYRELVVHHNDALYRCISERHGKGAKHSLYRDGEPLCEDATGQVYNELVERELQYTPALHKLLLQNTHFTEMGPGQRQDTLMEVSHLDLDYALGLFDRLRTRHRDIVGTIKYIEGRLEATSRDLAVFTTGDAMKARQSELADQLRLLHPLAPTHRVDSYPAQRRLDDDVESLQGILAKARELDDHADHPYGSFGQACAHEAQLRESISRLKGQEESLSKQLAELQRYTSVIENTDGGIEKIRQGIVDLDTRIASMAQIVDRAIEVPEVDDSWDIGQLRNAASGVGHFARWLQDHRVDNADQRVELEPWELEQGLQSLITTAEGQIKELDHVIATSSRELAHRREQLLHAQALRKGALTCPQCETPVMPQDALSDQELQKLTARVDTLTDVHDKSVEQREAVGKQLARYRGHAQYLRQIGHMLKQIPATYHFLVEYREMRLTDIGRAEEAVSRRLHYYSDHLGMVADLKEAKQQREEARSILATIEQNQQKMAGLSHASVEEKYHEVLALKSKRMKELEAVVADLKRYERLTGTLAEAESYIGELGEAFADWANREAQMQVQAAGDAIQRELGVLTVDVDKIKHLEGQRTDLETSLESLRVEKEATAALIRELSPKDGFIAEQMLGFISDFVEAVNRIIEMIWEYPLEVKPCGLSKGRLDYKFPVLVDGEPSEDIKETSEGQKEVINLAFTVVVLTFKGLSQYPLFLDEVGSAFDHQHRGNFIRFIKRLLEEHYCEQIFMVNHFSSDYGGLANAETLVLSKQNIVTPTHYNQHASIQYQ